MRILLIFVLCFAKQIQAQNKTITTSGDILTVVIPAAAFASTFIWNQDNTKAPWQATKAFVSGFVLQQALKHIVGKERPDKTDNLSFPSGHSTTAFSGAGYIHFRYGFKYAIPAYLLASWVGYSRIQAKRHDIWDVCGGAIIGIGTSYIFAIPYKPQKLDMSFNIIEGKYVIGANYNF